MNAKTFSDALNEGLQPFINSLTKVLMSAPKPMDGVTFSESLRQGLAPLTENLDMVRLTIALEDGLAPLTRKIDMLISELQASRLAQEKRESAANLITHEPSKNVIPSVPSSDDDMQQEHVQKLRQEHIQAQVADKGADSIEEFPESLRFVARKSDDERGDDTNKPEMMPPTILDPPSSQCNSRVVQAQQKQSLSEFPGESSSGVRKTRKTRSKRKTLQKAHGNPQYKANRAARMSTSGKANRTNLSTCENRTPPVNELEKPTEQVGHSRDEQRERELESMKFRDRYSVSDRMEYSSAMDMIQEAQRIRRRTKPDYRTFEDIEEERRTGKHTGCLNCRRLGVELAEGAENPAEVYEGIVSTCKHVPLGGRSE